MVEQQDYTVEMAVVAFLAGLDGPKRSTHEAAVQKFARWYGRHRPVGTIRPRDVDAYCQTVVPAQAAALRAFFSYAYGKRLTSRGLASRVKVRKDPNDPSKDPRAAAEAIQVTREGLGSLQAQLDELRNQRTVVIEQMRTAAADKDFRENAPLQAAREEKSIVEGKILELEETLSRATVVDEAGVSSRISLGDTVILTNLASGATLTYKLVDSSEASASQGRLSASSPMGRAILGKATGDECEFAAPAGVFKYRVELSISGKKA
jgi:transcription elongation factor GreA